MRMRLMTASLTLAVASAALVGCAASSGGGTAPASATPAEIIGSVCTRCHPVDRIKTASHDAAAWKVTIDRMRGKGAAISDAQEQALIDFLAGGGGGSL